MKANPQLFPLLNWRGIVAVLLLGIVTLGCLTQKKVVRWNNDHPLEAAEYAADHFPCKASDTTIIDATDSTAFLASIMQLEDLLQEELTAHDSLLSLLDGADSSCDKYRPMVFALSQRNRILEEQIKNVQPVVQWRTREITTIDSSKAQATRLRNSELEKQVNDQDREILQLKGTSKTRLWMLISSGILNSLLLFLLFKTKKFKLPWKSS